LQSKNYFDESFRASKRSEIKKLTLEPVAERLGQLLGKTVKKLGDCIGPAVEKEIIKMQDGDVVLLENLRFYSEEEKNDPVFSRKLASLAEIYVDDAFGTAHRAR